MISNLLVFLFENSAAKSVIRLLLRFCRPKKDIKIRVAGQTIFASSFDRIVSLYLKKFSLMESPETEFFKSVVKKGMRVADVGSNLGYYTLIAADLIGREGEVFAFEPDAENFRLLQKNIAKNGYQNIEAVNRAVSDKTGKLRLFLSEENWGDHRIYNSDKDRQSVEILATSLDDFFQNRPVDFIKIDVEGAENMVFSGMQNIIKNNPRLGIMMEFWPHGLKMAGVSPRDFLRRIRDVGFSVYLIKRKPEPIDDQNLLKACRGRSYTNIFLKRI